MWPPSGRARSAPGVIGHEITHGFDDQGSHSAAGRKRDRWTQVDRTEFERLAARLAAQFDQYEVADGAKVNGKLTLGENIADLGAVAIALDALREAVGPDAPRIDGLTSDQRFFLAVRQFDLWGMRGMSSPAGHPPALVTRR